MTCIVGFVDKGVVYMGCDSLATAGNIEQQMVEAKLIRHPTCLIGYSGPVRMANLLRYAFVPPEHPVDMSAEQYLTTLFIDTLRKTLKDAGTSAKTNEQESNTGTMLVGYRCGLYRIGYDYGLMESASGFNAIGSGEEVALGAMYATKSLDWHPVARLRLALEAAEDLCAGVRGPFVFEEMGDE